MKKLIKTEMIEDYMQKNKISKTQLCKMCKISIKTLNKILANNINIDILAFFKIAKVLNIKVHQIFNER